MEKFGFVCEATVLVYAARAPICVLYAAWAFLLLAAVWWAIGYRFTFMRFSRLRLNS